MSEFDAEQQPEPTFAEGDHIDPMTQLALDKFRLELNPVGGLVAGFIAALAGATVWAAVTVFSGRQMGLLAIGVGFLVAMAVRKVGKGIDQSFAIMGAALALLAILLGNLFTVCHFMAEAQGMGYLQVLTSLEIAAVVELMKVSFSPMDLLFYGIAVYEGYKLSCRSISEQDLEAAAKGSAAQFSQE